MVKLLGPLTQPPGIEAGATMLHPEKALFVAGVNFVSLMGGYVIGCAMTCPQKSLMHTTREACN